MSVCILDNCHDYDDHDVPCMWLCTDLHHTANRWHSRLDGGMQLLCHSSSGWGSWPCVGGPGAGRGQQVVPQGGALPAAGRGVWSGAGPRLRGSETRPASIIVRGVTRGDLMSTHVNEAGSPTKQMKYVLETSPNEGCHFLSTEFWHISKLLYFWLMAFNCMM